MNAVVVQKALVVNKDGKILVLRRSDSDERRPLQWDLPGGHLEPGEEMIAGVEREIEEETGLKVSKTWPVYTKTEARKWNGGNEASIVFVLYATHTTDTEVTLSFEHDKYDWKTVEEALPLYDYPLHIEFLSYILEHKVAL